MKIKTHCKRGHKFVSENEIWFVDINGKDQRTCRKCYNNRRNVKYKVKYRNDKEFRNKEKVRISDLRRKRNVTSTKIEVNSQQEQPFNCS